MKTLIKTAIATASLVAGLAAANPAYAATCATATCTAIPVGTQAPTYDFLATPEADGTISATLGHTGIAKGTFTDTYTFTLPYQGLGSGSLATGTSVKFSPTDLDFRSVTVNGFAATLTDVGKAEFASIDSVDLTAGALNTIVVTGLSRGNGSYGGNATFVPTSAVPESATWLMMILGFGAIGGVMRRAHSKSEEKFTNRVRSLATA